MVRILGTLVLLLSTAFAQYVPKVLYPAVVLLYEQDDQGSMKMLCTATAIEKNKSAARLAFREEQGARRSSPQVPINRKHVAPHEGKMKTHPVAFKPMDDRIIVRRFEEKPTLILLTDREPNQMAEVLAVGPGAWDYEAGYRVPMEVKVGDVVLIPGAANRFPDWQDGEQLLIREADIAGTLNLKDSN